MPNLDLEGVRKSYDGGRAAVHDLTLHVRSGELLVLMGPTGCGKSTTLRLVAGLETPDGGTIRLDGLSLPDVPPYRRGISTLLQGENLFPHLRVRDNLLFGPRLRGQPQRQQESRMLAVAEDLGIVDFLDSFPGDLSGGERQLAAIGRAMMHPANLVLLDEPLAHLDGVTRRVIRSRLRQFQRKHGTTLVHVTHDQAEAMALADRLAVMRRGSIVQVGPPTEVYHQPRHAFVAEWLGDPPMNLFGVEWQARSEGPGLLRAGAWEALIDLPPAKGDLPPATGESRLAPGEYWAGVRPERLRLQDPTTPVSWNAVVETVEDRGDRTIVRCTSPVGPLQVTTPRSEAREGDVVRIGTDVDDLCFFARTTGERAYPPLRA